MVEILCLIAQSLKEFSQLLNTVEEERRRLVSCFLSFVSKKTTIQKVFFNVFLYVCYAS